MRYTITMSDTLAKRLKEIAKKEKITKSQLVEILVRKGLGDDKLSDLTDRTTRQTKKE